MAGSSVVSNDTKVNIMQFVLIIQIPYLQICLLTKVYL